MMKRFRSILLYANDTTIPESVLRRAGAIAAANETVLRVVDVLPDSEGAWLTVTGQTDLEQAVVTARIRDLDHLVAPIRQRGIDVQVQVLVYAINRG